MNEHDIENIRVDLPHAQGGVRYFFVRPAAFEKWHPWWGELFRFLVAVTPTESAGVDEQGAPVESAVMTGELRAGFLRLLQSAPAAEVAEHRTLRSALKMLAEHELDVPVRFFGRVPQT